MVETGGVNYVQVGRIYKVPAMWFILSLRFLCSLVVTRNYLCFCLYDMVAGTLADESRGPPIHMINALTARENIIFCMSRPSRPITF